MILLIGTRLLAFFQGWKDFYGTAQLAALEPLSSFLQTGADSHKRYLWTIAFSMDELFLNSELAHKCRQWTIAFSWVTFFFG
jgi:hypothetical protein